MWLSLFHGISLSFHGIGPMLKRNGPVASFSVSLYRAKADKVFWLHRETGHSSLTFQQRASHRPFLSADDDDRLSLSFFTFFFLLLLFFAHLSPPYYNRRFRLPFRLARFHLDWIWLYLVNLRPISIRFQSVLVMACASEDMRQHFYLEM